MQHQSLILNYNNFFRVFEVDCFHDYYWTVHSYQLRIQRYNWSAYLLLYIETYTSVPEQRVHTCLTGFNDQFSIDGVGLIGDIFNRDS